MPCRVVSCHVVPCLAVPCRAVSQLSDSIDSISALGDAHENEGEMKTGDAVGAVAGAGADVDDWDVPSNRASAQAAQREAGGPSSKIVVLIAATNK